MQLFNVAKVGCFLDAIGHSIEKRRGEEIKVLTLTLRVSPFDAKLATAMADGIKTTLFKLNTGDPKENLRRVDFKIPALDRQLVTVFASPDTEEPSIALDQVRVHGVYARMQKDRNDFDLVLKATFGPVGRAELEFVQMWLLGQRFCTTVPAEPLLDLESDGDDDADDLTDADEKARQTARPAPMWDEDGEQPAAAADESQATKDAKRAVGVRRKTISHQTKRKARKRGEARV